jgi:hypothetical protein
MFSTTNFIRLMHNEIPQTGVTSNKIVPALPNGNARQVSDTSLLCGEEIHYSVS